MAASWRSLDLEAKLKNAAGVLAGSFHHGSLRLFLPRNLQRADAENGLSGSRPRVQGSQTLKPVLQAWPPLLPWRRPMRASPTLSKEITVQQIKRESFKTTTNEAAPRLGSWRDRRPCLIPFRGYRGLAEIPPAIPGLFQIIISNSLSAGSAKARQRTQCNRASIGAAAVRAAETGAGFQASTASASRSMTSATGNTHRIVAV
jgi:hypothetical protein